MDEKLILKLLSFPAQLWSLRHGIYDLLAIVNHMDIKANTYLAFGVPGAWASFILNLALDYNIHGDFATHTRRHSSVNLPGLGARAAWVRVQTSCLHPVHVWHFRYRRSCGRAHGSVRGHSRGAGDEEATSTDNREPGRERDCCTCELGIGCKTGQVQREDPALLQMTIFFGDSLKYDLSVTFCTSGWHIVK